MFYTVYIVRCADDSLYTGITNDIDKRMRNHNEGKAGAKYTRSRRPVTLVYTESVGTMSLAKKREAAIKKLTRQEKIQLLSL
ncbi:MAG TPA: GIY-YIG nuclease family protein [Candidatus Kapabacteria bacterium]|nr:GIY-YIG nuclease family protein [Candidatus Kapabacteria bacterium]